MRKKSLRTVVLQPFILTLIIILATFIVFWSLDYTWVMNHSSDKIVDSIMTHTENRTSSFLNEPVYINKMLVSHIESEQLYRNNNLEAIESVFFKTYEEIYRDIPQISNISYGDDQKRYLGTREAEIGVFNLMLQDSRTNGDLIIYEESSVLSNPSSIIEGYDPTVRPWYAPAYIENKPIWTEIYINADEKMESTISTSIPVKGLNGKPVGVICVDVKLSGIHEFLSQDISIGNGIVFILDGGDRVVAQSVEIPTMIRDANDPMAFVMMQATLSDQKLLREAVVHMNGLGLEELDVDMVKVDGDKYFASIKKLESVEGLNWKIGVVIPEDDLMGGIRQRQIFLSLLMMGLVVMALVFVSVWLSKIIKPIVDSTQMATNISKGLWGTEIHLKGARPRETDDLVGAFNTMSVSLKQSFEEIKRKETQYRLLVENVDDMIYSFKLDGRLTSINTSFETQLGVLRESIIGKNIFEVIKDLPNVDDIKKQFEKFVKKPQKISFIYDRNIEGEKRLVLNITWIPVFDRKGNVESVLGTNNNVTELIEAQENLERMYRSEREKLEFMLSEKDETLSLALYELVEKEKMASLGNLVSGVSHEINTPLGVAVSAASYMENTLTRIIKKLENQTLTKHDLGEFLEKTQETTMILNTNLNRAAELVKSFKAIAIDQHMDDYSQVQMDAYIHTILLSLKHEYKNKGHVINIDCESGLMLYTRPGAISQILTNLIMNSLIHAYDEGESGQITIRVKAFEQHVLLEYEDDGKGMSSDILARMYEPFFTTNRGKGGSGLGLNVVYNLVIHQLHGKIEAKSVEGEYTRFKIEIPKKEEPRHEL